MEFDNIRGIQYYRWNLQDRMRALGWHGGDSHGIDDGEWVASWHSSTMESTVIIRRTDAEVEAAVSKRMAADGIKEEEAAKLLAVADAERLSSVGYAVEGQRKPTTAEWPVGESEQ